MALGFAICYIFQILLNIGGVTKFIPSTGVTLPLISYGLSSVTSTLIVFQIIQGDPVFWSQHMPGRDDKSHFLLRSGQTDDGIAFGLLNFGDIGDDEEMIKEGDENENNNNDEKEKNEDEKDMRKPGEKQKRRSKNECYGRDYKCGCGKEYLSYPALYTHIKTKHDGKTPEGTNANQIQNGKGRGRPRKNFLTNEEVIIRRKRENNRRYNENQSNELKDFLNHKNCSFDYFKKGELQFKMIYNTFGLLNSKEIQKIKKSETNNNNNINENNNIKNNENKNVEKNEITNQINENIDKYNIIDLFTDEMLNNSPSYKALYNCLNDLSNKKISEI